MIDSLRGGLIVSCQADEGEPLCDSRIMAAMAVAVELAGAVAVRVRGADDIRLTRAAVDVPVIGLTKRHVSHSPVYITPTWEDVALCLRAGAHIVALDATDRPRPDGLSLEEVVRRARVSGEALLLADVSTLSEGRAAAGMGFDLVSTTLAGYTGEALPPEGPDFELLCRLVDAVDVPVIAEGRIRTPEEALGAFGLGAWAVCVGAAITDPRRIAERFVRALS